MWACKVIGARLLLPLLLVFHICEGEECECVRVDFLVPRLPVLDAHWNFLSLEFDHLEYSHVTVTGGLT